MRERAAFDPLASTLDQTTPPCSCPRCPQRTVTSLGGVPRNEAAVDARAEASEAERDCPDHTRRDVAEVVVVQAEEAAAEPEQVPATRG